MADTPKVELPVVPAGTIKPSVPKEPPAEKLKETFGSDNFDPVNDLEVQQLPPREEGKDNRLETPKKTDVPAEEADKDKVIQLEQPDKTKAEPEKKEDKPKEPEKKLPSFLKPPGAPAEKTDKTEVKQVKVSDLKGKVTRDYTGYSEEQVRAFKQMSDEAYGLTKKVIDENRELVKLRDTSIYQHEHAYTLDPGYVEIQQEGLSYQNELQHYQRQLLLMDEGKPWRTFEGWDKNGQPVYGDERQPTAADMETVRLAVMKLSNKIDDARGKLAGYPARYKQTLANDLQFLQSERAKRFEWVSDPKLLDYTITVPGAGDKSIKEIRNEVSNMFPPYLRNHPAVEVCGDFMVSLIIGQAALAEAQNGKAIEQIKEQEAERVEPSSEHKPRTPAKEVHGVKEFHALPDGF